MKKIDELGISPWPWKRDATSAHDFTGECVFNCCTWNENSLKDARLIAAAPELYEALAAFVNWYEKNKPLPYEENGIQIIAHYAKKAIEKAGGESEAK